MSATESVVAPPQRTHSLSPRLNSVRGRGLAIDPNLIGSSPAQENAWRWGPVRMTTGRFASSRATASRTTSPAGLEGRHPLHPAVTRDEIKALRWE